MVKNFSKTIFTIVFVVFLGLSFINLENKTVATSAMPSGIPGCPELDLSIASALKKRMEIGRASCRERVFRPV